MTPTELVLSKLREHGITPRRCGKDWKSLCPAHDDRNPSLSIGKGSDGRALVHCHAGCETAAVCTAIGLRESDLMPPAEILPMPAKKLSPSSRIVETYDYRDEAGEVLFQSVRYEPKAFKQRKPKSGGGWTWSVNGVRVVPYRLPELLADPTQPVFVVEGEKDAEALSRLGLLATCNAGGAGKWTAEHAELLRGRAVVVLPDNDKPGRKHAAGVAATLQSCAASVRVVELPGLPPKGDVSDWLAAGGSKDDLLVLVDGAPTWTPDAVRSESYATPQQFGPILTCLADVEPQAVSWLWPARIASGRITLLVGNPGEGKSFLTIFAAARISTGTAWPDGTVCPLGSVILMSSEDDPGDTIRPRLDAHDADVGRVHLLTAIRQQGVERDQDRLISLADVEAIEAALFRVPDCKLIVVDPIGSFLGGKLDAHRDNEVRSVLAPIAALAERHGVAVLMVVHRRKSSGSSADELALGSRAFTGIARSVWHVMRDKHDASRRLLLPGKNNLAPEGDGLAFSISGEPARIAWEHEPVAMTADEALAVENQRERRPGPSSDVLESAADWLRSVLADGPRLAVELFDEWGAARLGSKRTLDRAKQSIGVVASRTVIPGPWWWTLPAKESTKEQVA